MIEVCASKPTKLGNCKFFCRQTAVRHLKYQISFYILKLFCSIMLLVLAEFVHARTNRKVKFCCENVYILDLSRQAARFSCGVLRRRRSSAVPGPGTPGVRAPQDCWYLVTLLFARMSKLYFHSVLLLE